MEDRNLWAGRTAAGRAAALGVLAAIPTLVYLYQFTVDDALIPARYAAHLARGLGYRFNAHGPSTDGVTALGFAHLLAPFASKGPLAALAAARSLGTASWLVAAGVVGAGVGAIAGSPLRHAALLLVLFSAPLGAWAGAGLESGFVVCLAALAAALPAHPAYSPWGGALAGAVAGLRPEMIAWSVVMALGRVELTRAWHGRALTAALAILPWCAVAVLRATLFGRAAPLAVLAKPSDLQHGLAYVLPNLVLTGAPLAALGPIAWRKLAPWPRTLAIAAFAHLGVVVLAGGDWMPLARLFTPVLPSLVLVVAQLLSFPSGRNWAVGRLVLGCAGEILLLALRGPSASHVLRDRLSLIEAARPQLAGATLVATIDVGWVGAATDADILDLAGATDLAIAALPGGHTSKAISGAFLTGRGPDHLVFLLAAGPTDSLEGAVYARKTEQRLAADPLVARSYRESWRSPPDLPVKYVLLSLEGGGPGR